MTGFLDTKCMGATLDCAAAESTCYYGSTKHLATKVNDKKTVFESDAENARLDIAETSSVLNASFTVDQNPRNWEERIEHSEQRLSNVIFGRKVDELAYIFARRHLERLEHSHRLELRLSNYERKVEELAKVCAFVYVCPFTSAKLKTL